MIGIKSKRAKQKRAVAHGANSPAHALLLPNRETSPVNRFGGHRADTSRLVVGDGLLRERPFSLASEPHAPEKSSKIERKAHLERRQFPWESTQRGGFKNRVPWASILAILLTPDKCLVVLKRVNSPLRCRDDTHFNPMTVVQNPQLFETFELFHA